MTAKRKTASTRKNAKAKVTKEPKTKAKTGTKKKAKAKTKAKTKEIIQTHAMEEKEKFEKTTLDQIWGDEGLSKYNTVKEEEYLEQIKFMNRSDLHSHAISIGILPVDNRDILVARLTREFKKHILSYQKPKRKTSTTPKTKISARARRILSEGK